MSEVAPGLHRIALPLVDNALGAVNVYLVESPGGPVLVDTGWDTPETLVALREALDRVGARPEDLSLIVLTHAHPDHCGLAPRLRELAGAPIALHRADWPLIDPDRRGGASLRGLGDWLQRHGLPAGELEAMQASFRPLARRARPFVPDRALADGEVLDLGPWRFEVRWTPGHSAGQVCLLDARRRVLIAGDHVLPTISPNIGLATPERPDPLGDYLASLARTRDFDVDLVLPGHGEPFHDLAGRVDALQEHHEVRLREILAALGDSSTSAYDLCRRLTWAGGPARWAELPTLPHALARGETV